MEWTHGSPSKHDSWRQNNAYDMLTLLVRGDVLTFQIRVSSPISIFQPMEMLFALMMFRP